MLSQSYPSQNNHGEEKENIASELIGIRHLKHETAISIKI